MRAIVSNVLFYLGLAALCVGVIGDIVLFFVVTDAVLLATVMLATFTVFTLCMVSSQVLRPREPQLGIIFCPDCIWEEDVDTEVEALKKWTEHTNHHHPWRKQQ